MSETFTCALCGKVKQKGRSDEEAVAEAREILSPAELAALVVICDACNELVEPELPRLRAELDQEAASAGMSYEAYLRLLAAEL